MTNFDLALARLFVEEFIYLSRGLRINSRHLARSGRLARSIAFTVPKWRSSARLRVGPIPGISCKPASRISFLRARAVEPMAKRCASSRSRSM